MTINTNLFVTLMAALFLILAPGAFAGKVYKWVDQNGNVHYGAEKPPTAAQELNIKVKPAHPATSSSTTTSESEADNKREDPEKTVKIKNKKELAEVEKKNAEIRKKNCSVAKKRLAAIKVGGRLYEVNEKGERNYWDDSTRQAKMSEAQSQVDEWCK
ncbi:MAG: DUF4124 domain-containing protein [Gammaproteobacteria bacterium]|jgi:hypothetical protein